MLVVARPRCQPSRPQAPMWRECGNSGGGEGSAPTLGHACVHGARCTQICGHTVPAGVTVLMPPLVTDRDADAYGPDPDVFRPERCVQCVRTVCACVCACVRVCVCACVRVCMRACVRASERALRHLKRPHTVPDPRFLASAGGLAAGEKLPSNVAGGGLDSFIGGNGAEAAHVPCALAGRTAAM